MTPICRCCDANQCLGMGRGLFSHSKSETQIHNAEGNNKHLDDSNKGIGCLRRQREAKANDDPAKEEHLGM
jgi:hypothetical protein